MPTSLIMETPYNLGPPSGVMAAPWVRRQLSGKGVRGPADGIKLICNPMRGSARQVIF